MGDENEGGRKRGGGLFIVLIFFFVIVLGVIAWRGGWFRQGGTNVNVNVSAPSSNR